MPPPAHPDNPAIRVSRETQVLLVSIMITFFAAATLFTLQAYWVLWVIPLVPAIVVVTILVRRDAARRRRAAYSRGIRSGAREVQE